jgi:hypothetical protein
MNATYGQPPDMFNRFSPEISTGDFGHGGSVSDPYALRLYQSSSEAIPGGHLVNLSRKNAEYDKIVDEVTSPAERHDEDECGCAMAIWLPELPDVQSCSSIIACP